MVRQRAGQVPVAVAAPACTVIFSQREKLNWACEDNGGRLRSPAMLPAEAGAFRRLLRGHQRTLGVSISIPPSADDICSAARSNITPEHGDDAQAVSLDWQCCRSDYRAE